MREATLHEWIVGFLLLGVGFLVVSERLREPRSPAALEDARARAAVAGDRLLQRLSMDLSHAGPELGAVERCRMLPNGVLLRKAGDGRPVTYTWDASRHCVRRAVGDNAPQVVARGISAFAVATNPDGQVIVTVESRRETGDRDVVARRTVRIAPE